MLPCATIKHLGTIPNGPSMEINIACTINPKVNPNGAKNSFVSLAMTPLTRPTKVTTTAVMQKPKNAIRVSFGHV